MLASRQVPDTAFLSHMKMTGPLRGAAIAALKSCIYIFLSELEVPCSDTLEIHLANAK